MNNPPPTPPLAISSRPNIPIGIGPSNIWPITIVSGGNTGSTLDLTTVTGVTFGITRPDGSSLTVSGAIQGTPSQTELLVYYAFQGSEVTVVGLYNMSVELIYAGGSTFCYALGFFGMQPEFLAP